MSKIFATMAATDSDIIVVTLRGLTYPLLRDLICSGIASHTSRLAQSKMHVNLLWRTKSQREATEIVAAAVRLLDVPLHFIPFLWACVDTHRHDQRKKARGTQTEAECTRLYRVGLQNYLGRCQKNSSSSVFDRYHLRVSATSSIQTCASVFPAELGFFVR